MKKTFSFFSFLYFHNFLVYFFFLSFSFSFSFLFPVFFSFLFLFYFLFLFLFCFIFIFLYIFFISPTCADILKGGRLLEIAPWTWRSHPLMHFSLTSDPAQILMLYELGTFLAWFTLLCFTILCFILFLQFLFSFY